MSQPTASALLEELRQYDTPSITNVVATYPDSEHCLGLYNPWTENWYTDTSIRCMYPELGRTVGYAVTCVFGLPDPNYSRRSFLDVIDALDASPKPTVLILQQKFPPQLANKVGLAGSIMTTAMQAVGCVGVISNGPVTRYRRHPSAGLSVHAERGERRTREHGRAGGQRPGQRRRHGRCPGRADPYGREWGV